MISVVEPVVAAALMLFALAATHQPQPQRLASDDAMSGTSGGAGGHL